MGERAQKVVIRENRVELSWTQWGGQSCAVALLGGTAGSQSDLEDSDPTDAWMDPAFAEGGYLVDFDRKAMLLYSWDGELLRSVIERLPAIWPNWSIEMVQDGIPDFRNHIDCR